jgi:hypothetical protein
VLAQIDTSVLRAQTHVAAHDVLAENKLSSTIPGDDASVAARDIAGSAYHGEEGFSPDAGLQSTYRSCRFKLKFICHVVGPRRVIFD